MTEPNLKTAVIFKKVSQLKPEIRLGQAIKEFEADLSASQKQDFNSLRAQSCAKAPQVEDVLYVTALVDRQAAGHGIRRCIGPRFAKFLQITQQWVALGDIVIGGTGNLVAAGVWAAVRMCLTVSIYQGCVIGELYWKPQAFRVTKEVGIFAKALNPANHAFGFRLHDLDARSDQYALRYMSNFVISLHSF